MKNRLYLVLFALFFIFSTGNLNQILACMCGKASACEKYNFAAVAFVGTAINIEESKRGSFTIESTVFEVKESFLGAKKQIKVQNKSGFSCDIQFEKGETYLIFAGQTDDGVYVTGFCSGNLPLAYASDEITELRKIAASPANNGKLTGSVLEEFKRRDVDLNRAPLANVRLDISEIETNRKYKAVSDQAGRYEAIVPPGKYKLALSIPADAKLKFFEENEIYTVKPRGCAEGYYVLSNKSGISGKVTGADGKPVSGVNIELLSKDFPSKNYRGELNYESKTDGSFRIEEIPAGKYTLSVNYTTAPDSDSPFSTTFYPNASTLEQAQTIEIKQGTQINGIDFKLPSELAARAITGTVFWEDGSLAQNAEIYISDSEFPGFTIGCILKSVPSANLPADSKIAVATLVMTGCSPKTNASGEFSLSGFSSRKYLVKARSERKINGQTVEYQAESDIFPVDKNPVSLKLVLKPKQIPVDKQ